MKKIIAIVGLPGSGKTEVINYLIKKFNWPKIYFGDATFDEIKKRHLKINEKNERIIREELRKNFGMAAYAIKSLPKIKKELKKSDTVLVESLYSWEEYLELKKEFADKLLIIAVYAPPDLRYKRLSERINNRPLTPTEAKSRDYSQIENLHQAGPIAMADYTINNSGTIKNLQNQIEHIMGLSPNT